MSMQTKLIGKVYLRKLEMGLIYDHASRKIKGYSEMIFLRLQDFKSQDMNHATALHGFMLLLQQEGQSIEDLAIEPFCVVGIGERKEPTTSEDGDDDKDAFREMCCLFMDTLEKLELQVQDCILTALADPRLEELSRMQINLQDLLTISKDRVSIFRDISSRVKNHFLFNRKKEILWKCTYCGLPVEEQEAPETCSCCNSAQSFIGAGTWGIP